MKKLNTGGLLSPGSVYLSEPQNVTHLHQLLWWSVVPCTAARGKVKSASRLILTTQVSIMNNWRW